MMLKRGVADASGSDSHDDFKPKRKAPPSDLDGAIKMIDDQVRLLFGLCDCSSLLRLATIGGEE